MPRLRLILCISLLGAASLQCGAQGADTLALDAQGKPNRWRTLITRLTDVGEHVEGRYASRLPQDKHDTLYMERSFSTWTGVVYTRVAGTESRSLYPIPDADPLESRISAPLRLSMGVGIRYGKLSLLINLRPDKLFRKSKDLSYALSSNGNRMGFDFAYNVRNNLSLSLDDHYEGILKGNITQKRNLYLSAYYVFNARRFSWAAAAIQTFRQKRSAGSLIAGAYYFHNQISGNGHELTTDTRVEIHSRTQGASLNVGYAYNYVTPNRRWLIHLSALPGLVFYRQLRNNVLTTQADGQEEESIYRGRASFPSLCTVGRFALVRYLPGGYLSLASTIHSVALSDRHVGRTLDTEWRAQLSYAFAL